MDAVTARAPHAGLSTLLLSAQLALQAAYTAGYIHWDGGGGAGGNGGGGGGGDVPAWGSPAWWCRLLGFSEAHSAGELLMVWMRCVVWGVGGGSGGF
eukprot:336669-Chlamydomonas_euryale.AAC.1